MTKRKNPNITVTEALKLAWKQRKDYKGYDTSAGSMFNTWRAIIRNKKTRVIGFPESWKSFETFKIEVGGSWQKGLILCRKDISKPYSANNVEWREKGQENIGKLALLEYNGEKKTLIEWCSLYGLNYNGVRQRFFKGKGYTSEQILFGKNKRFKNTISDINDLSDEHQKNQKAAKMLAQYRLRDKKKGFTCDIELQWFRESMANGCCHYCGDTKRLGLDRIDNNKGHTKDNVVLCCYDCNVARGNNFSYEEMLVLGRTIRMIKDNRHEDKKK